MLNFPLKVTQLLLPAAAAELQLQVQAFQCAWALPRWAVEQCLEVQPKVRSVCSFGAGCGPVRLAVPGI